MKPLLSSALLLAAGYAFGRQRARAVDYDHGNDIIAHATEAIISTTSDGTIVIANESAAALFGTSVAAMRGAPLDRYLSPLPLGETGLAPYFGDTGRVGRRATDYPVSAIRSDGSTFPIEGSTSTVLEGGRPLHTIILRDISGRSADQDKLSRSHTQLRQLSAALQTIREEERAHIARELHDDLGQLLATLRMDLSLLRKERTRDLGKLLDGMEQNLLTAITSLRRIASNLRPRALDEGGLFFALQGLRNEFVERYGIACTVYADEAELRLGDAASIAIFRIVQEALTNIARHAHASQVTITLYRVDGEVLLTVRDDGRGIQPGDLDKAASLGLVGMRERVLNMNGDISIHSDDPPGTRIDIVLPLLVRLD
ncbi:ATP-binding protein [Massilia sp. PWRC2]|uniref:sensor histidine kinase n=1 Tax=Massilia sp. PWRC2 TaxID=2804626 RepID=UPI003CEA97CE